MPSPAVDRLKAALHSEAVALGLGGRQSFPTAAGAPSRSQTIEGWRMSCYQELRLLCPELDSPAAARIAVDLSRDPDFTLRAPAEVAVLASRLLLADREVGLTARRVGFT